MNDRIFDVIDWTRPWLAPLIPAAEPILSANDWRTALNAAASKASLCNHRGLPIRFVPQSDLPAGTAYEAFISATGCVPTRENLHDFFNALVWLTFPAIKTRLNALQAEEIARSAALSSAVKPHHSGRGKVRDAATIFDENAALLITRNKELFEALREHRWHEVFLMRRTEFMRTCEVWLFGHALMEKLVVPYKAITAHVFAVAASRDFFTMSMANKRAWIDRAAAQHLGNGLDLSDFTPLPVLGIPDWWAHQDIGFYNDVAVFRPNRRPAL